MYKYYNDSFLRTYVGLFACSNGREEEIERGREAGDRERGRDRRKEDG